MRRMQGGRWSKEGKPDNSSVPPVCTTGHRLSMWLVDWDTKRDEKWYEGQFYSADKQHRLQL
jgi:hypothetical protein